MKTAEGSALSLEVVILLVFGVFMTLFGVLLYGIHRGAIPYSPDSMYGLFLVLVSIQAITLGRTPFGDLRRSWAVLAIGTFTAAIGIIACFIPGPLTALVRALAGLLLTAGGATLVFKLFVHQEQARTWLKGPLILRHLTLAAGVVYLLSVVLGIITLLPGLTTDPQTAILLIAFGIGFFYLAWSLHEVGRRYRPETEETADSGIIGLDRRHEKPCGLLSREAKLPLSIAILLLQAVLLSLLGLLLFPVTFGVLPFSPDGQFGLALVIMAIQMMALGATPIGEFRRSSPMTLIGIGFAALGIFSCIVPGVLTGQIRLLLGLLNLIGGALALRSRLMPVLRKKGRQASEGGDPPQTLKMLSLTLTLLNIAQITFGLSMIAPGLMSARIGAGIVVINGLLLFGLARMLMHIDAIANSHDTVMRALAQER